MYTNFFGRSNEIESLLAEIMKFDTEKRIIYIQGTPHVGKTMLQNALQLKLKDEKVFVDYFTKRTYPINYVAFDFQKSTDNTYKDEFEIVDDIYRGILRQGWQGIKFPRYELARCYLYNLKGFAGERYKIDNVWPSEHVDRIIDVLKTFSSFAIDLVGIFSSDTDLITGTIIKMLIEALEPLNICNNLAHFINEKFYNTQVKKFVDDVRALHDELPPSHVADQLTHYFLTDLNEYCNQENNVNVILVDTYEVISKRGLDNNWFYQKLIKLSESVLWIILGTDEYAFDGASENFQRHFVYPPKRVWLEEKAKPYQWVLRNFDENESQDLICKKVSDKNLSQWMYTVSGGHPGALGILLDTYDRLNKVLDRVPVIEDFQAESNNRQFYKDLMNDVYKKHLTDSEKIYFHFLSTFGRWDWELFQFFSYQNNITMPHKAFEQITKQSIVRKVDDQYYTLLDLAKESLYADMSISDRKYYAKLGYQYYKKQCEEKQSEWVKNSLWDFRAYEDLKWCSENAVRFGALQCSDNKEFNDYATWFVDPINGKCGFENRLTITQLYSLKASLIHLFLDYIDNQSFEEKVGYQLQVLYDLSWSYIYVHDYVMALESMMKRLYLGVQYRKSYDEVNTKCFYSLGVIFQRWGQYDNAEYWHTIALEQREKRQNYTLLAISYNALADVKMNLNQFSDAYQMYFQAYQIRCEMYKKSGLFTAEKSKAEDYLLGLITIRGNVSKLYFLQGVADNSIINIDMAIKKAKQCVRDVKLIYGNKRVKTLDYDIRIYTAKFQRLRMIDRVPTSDEMTTIINFYKDSINYWSQLASVDKRHNILNTQHNLAIAYAYINKNECGSVIKMLRDNLNSRRNRSAPGNMQNTKNINIARKNLKILEKDCTRLKELTLIY